MGESARWSDVAATASASSSGVATRRLIGSRGVFDVLEVAQPAVHVPSSQEVDRNSVISLAEMGARRTRALEPVWRRSAHVLGAERLPALRK